MARYEATALTADGRSDAFPIYNAHDRGGGATLNTVIVQGSSFGGGTATLQLSADGGSTWIDAVDSTNSVVQFTGNGARNVTLASEAAQPIQLSINLAGATSPNISFIIYSVR